MASSDDKLTPLQRQLLHAFFDRERGFYLTGGAALAGFYLRHRHTTDLDLFTSEADAFERGRHALFDAALALGGRIEARLHAPGFERYVVHRGPDAVVVDLVLDRAPRAFPGKVEQDGIVLDPVEEILANKLTTLLSRAEERDLVDVLVLERAGYRAESGLSAALAKDGGCTPGMLAWVLSEIEIPDEASLPGNISAAELRDFVADLIRRLRRLAAPLPLE